VTAVELLPEVIDASAHFTEALDRDMPGPSPTLVHADARRFVRSSDRLFDVIVSDNFHPARSGSAALYTVEHFEAVKARLAPGGVFCQWLPLHQMDLDTLRSIVASFLAVHPRSWAMLATNSLETPVIGVVAMRDGERVDPKRLRERLDRSGVRAGAGKLGVTDELSLLGNFVAGPEALARFAADAPRNTDDHPVVAYRAPRITYAPDATPAERLLALIGAVRIAAPELLGGRTGREGDDALPARLERYWEARNRFLAVGVGVRPTGDPQRMLEQVREPLLAVVRLSPDFRPAYDPLLRMAQALYGSEPAASRALLTALQEAAPTRPEAGAVLRELPARDAR
jgi:spermidine synthase